MDFTRSLSLILAAGFAMLALGTPPPVSAQPYEFVRVTCVPENQYLEITYETVEQDVVDDGNQGGDAFAKHGYLDPHSLDY